MLALFCCVYFRCEIVEILLRLLLLLLLVFSFYLALNMRTGAVLLADYLHRSFIIYLDIEINLADLL